MRQEKYTPGPWFALRDFETERNLSPYETNNIRYMGVQMGDVGGFILDKRANRHANSILMAHSPDLVGALKLATDELSFVVKAIHFSGSISGYNRRLEWIVESNKRLIAIVEGR